MPRLLHGGCSLVFVYLFVSIIVIGSGSNSAVHFKRPLYVSSYNQLLPCLDRRGVTFALLVGADNI